MRFLVKIILIVVFIFFLAPQAVWAGPTEHDPDTPRTASPDSPVATSGTPPETSASSETQSSGGAQQGGGQQSTSGGTAQSIPGTFDINQLKATGQKFSGAESVGASGGILGFFVRVIDLLVKIIGSLSLLVFIIGALMTITSEGKEDRLEKGKNAMLYAVIGLLVALFSFIIVTFVQSILF